MKATPRLLKKAIQESKHRKPRLVCTYCTGRSGLNLRTEETKTRVSVQEPKISEINIFGV